jgi:outer membrane lipoprotein-sorting protein
MPWLLAFVLVFAMAPPGAAGATAAELLARARAQATAPADKSMRVTMRIVSPSGTERTRGLRGYEKAAAGGRRILWIFESPAELSGTSFLAQQERDGHDALWVYFPGQRRVRQVANQLRREQFQGSAFTYEDLTAIFYFDYGGEHRLREEAPCADTICDVVETILPPGEFAYARLVTWLRRDTQLPDRVEFHTTALQKVMRLVRTERIQGHPTIVAMEMTTPGDGYRTIVEYADVRYDTHLDDGMFSIDYLAKGK